MSTNGEMPAWARKYVAQQQVIIDDLQELAAGIEIARALNESPSPAKRELKDDEISPDVEAVLREAMGEKPPLGDDVSPMMKDVLKSMNS